MSPRDATDSGTLQAALAVARVEWLRFLRRDALVALPVACVLGAVVLVRLPAPPLAVSPWPWWLAAVVNWERLRNCLVVIEAVALATTALVYAWWSLDRDRRNAAWRIVQHAPSGRDGLLLGRALGVVGCVALMHAMFATVILSTVPIFHRSGASLLLELAGPLALAVTLVPDGLVATQQSGQRAGRYLALRLAQAARFVVPALVALAFTSGTTLGARVQAATDAVVRYLDGSDALVAVSAAVASPGWLLVVLAAWQLASTLVLWRLYVVREPMA